MSEFRKKNLAVPVGLVFIALAILLTATALERAVFPEGTIPPHSRRSLILGLARIFALTVGVYFLWRRPLLQILHICAFLIVSGVCAAIAVIGLQLVYVPAPIVSGWRSFAPAAEQNQFGFRGQPISYGTNDFVVVLLGDSQVEGMAMPVDSMPERLLESHLKARDKRVKVFSIGAGGYGFDQELLALQEYFQKFRADLVLLWQTPGNDVWNNLFRTHMFARNPKPTFWLENGSLSGPTEGLGDRLANSPIVVVAMWQRIFGLPFRDRVWERNLPEPYSPLARYDGPVNKEWQERWDTNRGRMQDENLATEKSHLTLFLTPRSKRTQHGLDLTRALQKRLQELIESKGGELRVIQVETPEPKAQSRDEEVYVLNGKYYRVSRQQEKASWDYINKDFELVRIPVTVEDWRVGPEDGHLNMRATDQVMQDLARIVEKNISANSRD